MFTSLHSCCVRLLSQLYSVLVRSIQRQMEHVWRNGTPNSSMHINRISILDLQNTCNLLPDHTIIELDWRNTPTNAYHTIRGSVCDVPGPPKKSRRGCELFTTEEGGWRTCLNLWRDHGLMNMAISFHSNHIFVTFIVNKWQKWPWTSKKTESMHETIT